MSDRPIDWRRVSRGVCWVGVGTFLLLNTLGFLSWSFWYDALLYWPVLLVALGIRLIFERTGAPWAILLSPLLVLGTLTYVAVTGPQGPPGDWYSLRAERTGETARWTLAGDLALARLELRARPLGAGLLLEGRAASGRHPSVQVTRGRDAARVRLRGRERGWAFILPSKREQWELGVAPDLPLALDLDLAGSGGEIDLTTVSLSRLDLEGAFNNLTLRLGEPESDVRLDLEGAFNLVEVVVPFSVPVRARTDGFLNFVDSGTDARSLDRPGYRLRLDGAFNRLLIRSE